MSDGMTARWDSWLARSDSTSPAEFARRAREILGAEGGRAYVTDRLRDPDFGPPAWALAKWAVEEQAKAGGDAWIAEAVAWLDAKGADWRESASFCADVAWTARAARNSALLHLTPRDLPQAISTPGELGLLHILLQSQRYDFRFRSIRETVASLETPRDRLDLFSRAIHAFALLSENAPGALAELEAVGTEGGDNEKVAHALLHGLWMATDLPDQAERIIQFVDSSGVLRDDDPIVALRKAYALRKLRRYREAFQAIDLGLLHLSPAAIDVHQDFSRERSMILVARDIEESYERERQLLGDQARRHVHELDENVAVKADQIESKMGDALFKMVEILALFTAIVALLASGAASVTIGNLEWWQRGVLMLVAGTVVMIFFFAIRIVVQPRKRRPR